MKRVFLLAAAAMVLAGCMKTEIDHPAGGKNPGGGSVYDPAKIVTITTGDGATRGTPIDNVSEMTDMGVFCSYTAQSDWTVNDTPDKIFNEQLVRNTTTGEWEYTGTPVKWNPTLASDRYTFFAYAPYATTSNGITVNGTASTQGTPTLTYTVPSDVADQPDLMVAVPQKNLRHTGNPVRLQMEHALTCVGFQVAGTGEKIKKIAITGVSVTETLSMDGGNIVWSATGTKTTADFTASINKDSGQNYFTATSEMSGTGTRPNFLASNGYLMMIPQTLGTKAKIVLTLDNDDTIEIGLDGYSWTPGKRVNYIITLVPGGTVTVTPQTLVLPYFGVNHLTDNIEVICSKANGDPDPDRAWTLTTADDWLTLTLDDEGTGAAQTVSGTGSQTVYTVATANTSTTNTRSTTVTLNGTTDVVCTAVQLKKVTVDNVTGGGTVLTNSYVGAFWRKDQTGERIIKIGVGTTAGNLGDWAASVVWTDVNWAEDDIILSTEAGESDAILYTDDPGLAEDYQVDDNQSAVGGTVASGGTILFRIGLKTKWSEHANYDPENTPARYAVILLSYNNYTKHQKIFLRQGEDADYLMRPTDPGTANGGWDGLSRPMARKFSPYNLTHPDLKTADEANTDWTAIANHPQVPARTSLAAADAPDYFTDFPTQVGALFQWANTNQPRRAYHPANPSGAITGWQNNYTSGYWDSFYTAEDTGKNNHLHETCPPGWRRPADGPINKAVGTGYATHIGESEARQSLWLKPQTGSNDLNSENAIFGYYADGLFDRRPISSNAVISSSANVASSGCLFFNLTNNASFFLPTWHTRLQTGGSLNSASNKSARSWTSSFTASANRWMVYMLSAADSRMYFTNAGTGVAVRCVVDPDYVAP